MDQLLKAAPKEKRKNNFPCRVGIAVSQEMFKELKRLQYQHGYSVAEEVRDFLEVRLPEVHKHYEKNPG